MATQYFFGGKVVKLPGAYSEIKAQVASPNNPASYGKVLIVDTGSNTGWGGGSGVSGELNQGKNSVYVFNSPEEMKAFVKGGKWYNLADNLFKPSKSADTVGVSQVIWISAKQTTAASFDLVFLDLEVTLTIKCKDEGTFSNGILTNSILSKGYAMTAHVGVKDPTKIFFKFWVSTYTGVSLDNLPFNEVKVDQASPEVVAISPEVSKVDDLVNWMNSDYNFGLGFSLDSVVGVGQSIGSTDISSLVASGNLLFSGGTETYGNQDLESALDAVKVKDSSFCFFDKEGSDLLRATATRLQYFCQTEAKFKKQLVTAGGSTRTEFTTVSVAASTLFNSDSVLTIHGSVKRLSSLTSTKTRSWSAMTHAALILGRIAGCSPEVPATWKEIDIQGLDYELSEKELESCLDSGILTTYWDEELERYCILKGVNTLQNNQNQVNPDGTTPAIQIKRIELQINKELVLDCKKELCSQRNGVNVLTVSEEFLADWTIIKLKQKADRGLIVSYDSVNVERQGDAYFTSYRFQANEEINFFFFTGFLVEN